MTDGNEQRARAEARVGTVLHGKYRVDAVLGVGGMGAVYATTHRNQKRFAVKVLHPELSLRTDLRQRFVREGYVANSLNHPGAVTILDDDVADDGAAFLVMELLEGATGEEVWQEAPDHHVPPAAVMALAHQVLDTLAAAHAKSIVHRDIKPANLFLQRDGLVKVLDFGIARVKDASGTSGKTNTGALLGTPAFMAPEQAAGETSAIDGRTDVWAVGATMFALLSGDFVHVGESGQQIVIHAATKPARSLGAVCPELPARLVAIVDRALSFDRADRGTAAETRDALAEAYVALFEAPVSQAPLASLVAETRARSSKRVPAAAAAGPSPRPATAAHERFPSEDMPLATTAQSVSKAAPRTTPPARRGVALFAGAGVLGLAALATSAFVASRSRPASLPVASAPTPAPSAVAPPPPASAVPEPLVTAVLAMTPVDASVEVDGVRTTVTDGGVALRGVAGSMHIVHVVSGSREGTYPVLLTPSGPVPRQVELAPQPPATLQTKSRAPARGSDKRSDATSQPASSPSASASTPTISRTME